MPVALAGLFFSLQLCLGGDSSIGIFDFQYFCVINCFLRFICVQLDLPQEIPFKESLLLVLQNFQLLPRQTAVENVALPLIYAGVGKRERLKRAAAALDKVGLSDRINFVPNQLSGGQKQRAAIASAIASGRSVLFLDEPTSGLDHKHMLEVAEVLREVWDTGISVYVITHDLELIIECCTDVIHFENGTIADQYQMDAEGMEKIRKYFIQEKCCGKWSKSD